MFTGIISHLGKIENITHPNDWELSVKVENNKNSPDFDEFANWCFNIMFRYMSHS